MVVLLFKHRNNTTVAVEILKRFYVREKKLFKMKVCWWNIGQCHEPWSMNIVQRIEVPVEVWARDWEPYPKMETIVDE